jgi:hypothetical protein
MNGVWPPDDLMDEEQAIALLRRHGFSDRRIERILGDIPKLWEEDQEDEEKNQEDEDEDVRDDQQQQQLSRVVRWLVWLASAVHSRL